MDAVRLIQGLLYLVSVVLIPINYFRRNRILGLIGFGSLGVASIITLVQLSMR